MGIYWLKKINSKGFFTAVQEIGEALIKYYIDQKF